MVAKLYRELTTCQVIFYTTYRKKKKDKLMFQTHGAVLWQSYCSKPGILIPYFWSLPRSLCLYKDIFIFLDSELTFFTLFFLFWDGFRIYRFYNISLQNKFFILIEILPLMIGYLLPWKIRIISVIQIWYYLFCNTTLIEHSYLLALQYVNGHPHFNVRVDGTGLLLLFWLQKD